MRIERELQNRIEAALAEDSASGRFLADLLKWAMDQMTKDQLTSEVEDFE